MKPKTVGRSDGTIAVMAPMNPAGLAADSIILTLDGEKRVGDIRPGDRAITRDSGMAVVKHVDTQTITTRAVRIKAGSLGHTRPERDVTLPADQQILVRDWRAKALFGATQAMVPAARLVDGEFVTLIEECEMSLYTLGFDRTHVLYVDGLELPSETLTPLAQAA